MANSMTTLLAWPSHRHATFGQSFLPASQQSRVRLPNPRKRRDRRRYFAESEVRSAFSEVYDPDCRGASEARVFRNARLAHGPLLPFPQLLALRAAGGEAAGLRTTRTLKGDSQALQAAMLLLPGLSVSRDWP